VEIVHAEVPTIGLLVGRNERIRTQNTITPNVTMLTYIFTFIYRDSGRRVATPFCKRI